MKCSSGTNGGFGLDVLTFSMYVIPFCYNIHNNTRFKTVSVLLQHSLDKPVKNGKPFWILMQQWISEVVAVPTGTRRREKLQRNNHHQHTIAQFLHAACLYYRTINSVKALKANPFLPQQERRQFYHAQEFINIIKQRSARCYRLSIQDKTAYIYGYYFNESYSSMYITSHVSSLFSSHFSNYWRDEMETSYQKLILYQICCRVRPISKK